MLFSLRNIRWYHLPLLPVGAVALLGLVAIELPGMVADLIRERLRRF